VEMGLFLAISNNIKGYPSFACPQKRSALQDKYFSFHRMLSSWGEAGGEVPAVLETVHEMLFLLLFKGPVQGVSATAVALLCFGANAKKRRLSSNDTLMSNRGCRTCD